MWYTFGMCSFVRWLLSPVNVGYRKYSGVFDLPPRPLWWWVAGVACFLGMLAAGFIYVISHVLWVGMILAVLFGQLRVGSFLEFVFYVMIVLLGWGYRRAVKYLESRYDRGNYPPGHWSRDLVERGQAVIGSNLVIFGVSLLPVWLALWYWIRKLFG